jgi:hypothetical protein
MFELDIAAEAALRIDREVRPAARLPNKNRENYSNGDQES